MDNKSQFISLLRERIKAKESQINELEQRLRELEQQKLNLMGQIDQARNQYYALDVTLNSELGNDKKESDTKQIVHVDDATHFHYADTVKPVNKKTIADVAYEILEKSDQPLPVSEITERAKKIYNFQAKKPNHSVTTSLHQDDRFESVGHGVWRIIQKKEGGNVN